MKETLQKSPYDDLNYAELSKLINVAYTNNPDLVSIAQEFGVSVSVVFETTGWKDYYEFVVDNDWFVVF